MYEAERRRESDTGTHDGVSGSCVGIKNTPKMSLGRVHMHIWTSSQKETPPNQ